MTRRPTQIDCQRSRMSILHPTTCTQCWRRSKACPRCRGAGVVADELLSPNFALSEFLKSGKAERGLIPNVPTSRQFGNARRLCVELFEPLRAEFGPVEITSGIRATHALNSAIGGSKTSSHLYEVEADAADTNWRVPRARVMERLKKGDLVFDQAIFEERTKPDGSIEKWIHLSSRKRTGERRRQLLMCFDGVHYLPWNPNDPRTRGL